MPFYKHLLPLIINTLAESYDAPDDNPRRDKYFTQSNHKASFKDNPYQSFGTKKIFTICATTINTEIRLAYQLYNKKVPERRIGLKAIRKLITTSLTEVGDPIIAQFFNRHNNPSTTQQYYTQENLASNMTNVIPMDDNDAYFEDKFIPDAREE